MRLFFEMKIVDSTGKIHAALRREIHEDAAFMGTRIVDDMRTGPEIGSALFIANAPTDIAFLLSEIDRLGKELEKAEAATLEWARRDAIKLFEATEEIEPTNDFERGRVYEAKHCRNAIAEAWRDEIQQRRDKWSTDQSIQSAAPVAAAGDATQLSATEDGEGNG